VRKDIRDTDTENDYFEWLCKLACGHRFSEKISYKKLLKHLYNTDFRYSIEKDGNRYDDGLNLRQRFLGGFRELDYVFSDKPCSVLEMMLALAIRCEENIMDDTGYGNRTTQWFWQMVVSLGLGSMNNDLYDADYVDQVLERFLDREYEPNGKGGLFTIRNYEQCARDIRDVEIWVQMCWYLDTIT